MPTRHADSFWKNATTCDASTAGGHHLAGGINTLRLKD